MRRVMYVVTCPSSHLCSLTRSPHQHATCQRNLPATTVVTPITFRSSKGKTSLDQVIFFVTQEWKIPVLPSVDAYYRPIREKLHCLTSVMSIYQVEYCCILLITGYVLREELHTYNTAGFPMCLFARGRRQLSSLPAHVPLLTDMGNLDRYLQSCHWAWRVASILIQPGHPNLHVLNPGTGMSVWQARQRFVL